MNYRKLILISFLASSILVYGDEDIDQTDLRLNPEIELETYVKPDYSSYPFLNLNANKIEMNGADWTNVKKVLSRKDSAGTLSIIYLGDSHIQADFGGSVIRKRLAERYGNAGRGLIIPFKQAGTNQPLDYSIIFGQEVVSSKLLKMPWSTEMPFTGIGICPKTHDYHIDIRSDEPFNSIYLHYRGLTPEVAGVKAEGYDLKFNYRDSIIKLESPQSSVRLLLNGDQQTTYGGFELQNNRKGTFLHSIGNNGATYSSYSNVDRFGSGISSLNPDLVIIALGTNEAFGKIEGETFVNDIENLVDNIRRHNPETQILMVSPTECFRKIYRRSKGRRRRTIRTVVNAKTLTIRNILKDFAKENRIAFYDLYEVMGGTGSAPRMKGAKVLGRDGVHFTAPGYRLIGSLLSDALIDELSKAALCESSL